MSRDLRIIHHMPRPSPRLPSLPLDASSEDVRAWEEKARLLVEEEAAERYGFEVIVDAHAALNTGRGEEAFLTAMNALAGLCGDGEDFEEFWRLYLAWLEPYINEKIGRTQRVAGGKGKGERREKYGGKEIPPDATFCEKVKAMHQEDDSLSFRQVCERVGKRLGYDSGWSTKKAVERACPDIKWSAPRRRKK